MNHALYPVIFCPLVHEISEPSPGDSLGKCDHCKQPIWINPNSQKVAKNKDMPLMCLDCAENYVKGIER